MKRILFTLIAGVATLGLQAYTPASSTGVKGTMHDLSSTGANAVTNVTQICVFCHTPHNASGAANGGQIIPLWNHTTSIASYTMYGGTTAAASTIPGSSLACLSCHDGTVAVGSLVNLPYANDPVANPTGYAALAYGTGGQTGTGKIVGSHAVGTDLSSDHPINITYVDDPGMVAAGSLIGVELFAGKVQCASCHDVHNWGGAFITGSTTVKSGHPFLRVDNTGSALCLSCHVK